MVKKLIKFVTQKKKKKLFNEATKQYNKAKKKTKKTLNEYRLSMLFGFEGGMRISEIVGYKRKDGTEILPLTKDCIEGNQIRIISAKGKKDRIVPKPKRVNEKAVNMLPIKIGRRALQKYVTKLGKQVLEKHITFHTLRHGFGSHLAGSGRPLHEIQMLMGHSRLDTTGIYLHANPVKAIEGAQSVF